VVQLQPPSGEASLLQGLHEKPDLGHAGPLTVMRYIKYVSKKNIMIDNSQERT
jgi:hypothetical protein